MVLLTGGLFLVSDHIAGWCFGQMTFCLAIKCRGYFAVDRRQGYLAADPSMLNY